MRSESFSISLGYTWLHRSTGRSKLRWQVAHLARELRAIETDAITRTEKNRAIVSHCRSYARTLWRMQAW